MQQRVAARDWLGAADQASYHLPLAGLGRSGYDAYQQGNPLGIAWYSAWLGLEVYGLRYAKNMNVAVWGGVRFLESRFPHAAKKFAQHAKDFVSVSDVNVFYKRAIALADSKVGGHILSFTTKQGTLFKMNSKTGEFLVINPLGKISTFYRRKKDPLKHFFKRVPRKLQEVWCNGPRGQSICKATIRGRI